MGAEWALSLSLSLWNPREDVKCIRAEEEEVVEEVFTERVIGLQLRFFGSTNIQPKFTRPVTVVFLFEGGGGPPANRSHPPRLPTLGGILYT